MKRFLLPCFFILVCFLCSAQLPVTIGVTNLEKKIQHAYFRTGHHCYLLIPKQSFSVLVNSDFTDEWGRSTFVYRPGGKRNVDTIAAGLVRTTGLYAIREAFYETDDSTMHVRYHSVPPEDSLRYTYFQKPGTGYSWQIGSTIPIQNSRQYIYAYASDNPSMDTDSSLLLSSHLETPPAAELKLLADSLAFVFNHLKKDVWEDSLNAKRQRYVAAIDSAKHFQFTLYFNLNNGLRLFVTDSMIRVADPDKNPLQRCKNILTDFINAFRDTVYSGLVDTTTKLPYPLVTDALRDRLVSIVNNLETFSPDRYFQRMDHFNADESLMNLLGGGVERSSSGVWAGMIRKAETQQFVLSVKIVWEKKQ